MTVSEYEERFWISSPSLHETFVAMQGNGPRRRRRQRFWAAIALAGALWQQTKSRSAIPLTMLRTVPRKWRTQMSDQPLYRPQDDRPVTQASADATAREIARMRDLRLDLFRDIALFLMFIDHIPGNVLCWRAVDANWPITDFQLTRQRKPSFTAFGHCRCAFRPKNRVGTPHALLAARDPSHSARLAFFNIDLINRLEADSRAARLHRQLAKSAI